METSKLPQKAAATRSGIGKGLEMGSDGDSSLILLKRMDDAFRVNEAMMHRLTAHLAEHIVIREELRARAERISARAVAEARGIPSFLKDVAMRLVGAGVVSRDV